MLAKCGRQVLLLSAGVLCSIVQLVLHGEDEVAVRGCLIQQHSPDEGRGAVEPHEGHPVLRTRIWVLCSASSESSRPSSTMTT